MFARKSLGAVLATSLASATVALTAGGANAAYIPHPDDSKANPVSADLVGGGSDTTMLAVKKVADVWNADPSKTFDIATFGAKAQPAAPAEPDEITLPGGTEILRPNGSGGGMRLLYGANNQPEFDFARSSSAVDSGSSGAAQVSAGLQAFPFAVDELVMVVSGETASHAPATITKEQLVGIYSGALDDWSDLPGGTAGAIKPMAPQTDSGTWSFFEGQLRAANGGNPVTLSSSLQRVQEHNPDPIEADADAIAPFSVGRIELTGDTVKPITVIDWAPKRGVFNVVRGADVERADIQAAFGEDGFFCSPAATAAIEAGGLKQLASAPAGVCGQTTQSQITNFATNASVDTTTVLSATSPAANTVRLTATVSPSSEGTVSFYEGATLVRGDVPVTSGQFVATLAGVAAGAHTYVAKFTPAASTFAQPSQSAPVTVTVANPVPAQPPAAPAKPVGKLKETFPAKVTKGKRATGTVKVVAPAKLTGTVTIMEGAKVLKSVKVKKGVSAKVSLPKLTKGKHTLTVVWAGNATYGETTLSFKITQK